ncbi:MAG: helix-turn-helix domain-containing protein [Patescibacteria group bacterium]|jgi:hypothetical protein
MNKIITLKEASELSGYNQDYLGSLIRGKKIEGQRMGRNWFVTESTLLEFMKQKNLKVDEAKLQDASSDSPMIMGGSDLDENMVKKPKIPILKIIIALAILAFALAILIPILMGLFVNSDKDKSDNGLMEVKTYYRDDSNDVSPPLN